MLSLGVDLASRPRGTAACSLRWEGGRAHVAFLGRNLDDDALLDLADGADAVAIDAPFGWPAPFVDFVTAHHAGRPISPNWEDPDVRRSLRLRRTDLWVWSKGFTGRPPLSVSTDLIAMPALRCVGLLGRLGVLDRGGDARVFEAYPAAALGVWFDTSSGYKGDAGTEKRTLLVERLRDAAPWLEVPDACVRDDDQLDALIAALVARCAVLGRTYSPPDNEREASIREGWIAVPKPDTLERLPYPS